MESSVEGRTGIDSKTNKTSFYCTREGGFVIVDIDLFMAQKAPAKLVDDDNLSTIEEV